MVLPVETFTKICILPSSAPTGLVSVVAATGPVAGTASLCFSFAAWASLASLASFAFSASFAS
eukprot:1391792-Pyramimonas_sp.AAC.1